MIKPIQSSVTFGNGMQDYIAKTSKTTGDSVLADTKMQMTTDTAGDVLNSGASEPIKEKTSFAKKFLNMLKGINSVKGTTSGFARGVAEGVIGAGIVGYVGKNIKDAEGNIGPTIIGMAKDAAAAAGHIITKSIPSIITKAPLENAKTLLSVPGKFYSGYLKGNRLTAALATLAFVGTVSFRTVQGKLVANKKNADIDHYTKQKH